MWASIDKFMFLFWLSASDEYINKYNKQHYDNIMANNLIIVRVLYYKKNKVKNEVNGSDTASIDYCFFF